MTSPVSKNGLVRGCGLVALCVAAAAPLTAVHAGEGFKLRTTTLGDLSGEFFSPFVTTAGWAGAFAVTHTSQEEMTDNNGNRYSAPFPAQVVPITGLGNVTVNMDDLKIDFRQKQTNANLVFLYRMPTESGDNLIFSVNAGMAHIDRNMQFDLDRMPVSTSSQFVPPAAIAANPAFAAGIDSAVGGLNSVNNRREGWQLADTEVSAAWLGRWFSPIGPMRVKTSLTLAIPTGDYVATEGVNAGAGDFYTLRPSVSVIYDMTSSLSLGAKSTLGFNTKNRDTNYKSGSFHALELALAHHNGAGRTFGVQTVMVNQYEDDEGGTAAAKAEILRQQGNKYKFTSMGVFASMPIASIQSKLHISYAKSVGKVKNGIEMQGLQVSLSRAF